jgi:hypothetical protein
MICQHARIAPEICDQTIGVVCLDCNDRLAVCWMKDHVSESLWNRACQNDAEATPTQESRDNVCAICGENIE